MNKPRKQPNQYTVKRDKTTHQTAKEVEPTDKVQPLPSIAELTAKRDLLVEQLGNIEKQVCHLWLHSFDRLRHTRLSEGAGHANSRCCLLMLPVAPAVPRSRASRTATWSSPALWATLSQASADTGWGCSHLLYAVSYTVILLLALRTCRLMRSCRVSTGGQTPEADDCPGMHCRIRGFAERQRGATSGHAAVHSLLGNLGTCARSGSGRCPNISSASSPSIDRSMTLTASWSLGQACDTAFMSRTVQAMQPR